MKISKILFFFKLNPNNRFGKENSKTFQHVDLVEKIILKDILEKAGLESSLIQEVVSLSISRRGYDQNFVGSNIRIGRNLR